MVGTGRRKRKGQFFILGAVLLCALFFIGMPPPEAVTMGFTQDLSYLHENIGGEFPVALNLGLNQSRSFSYLLNFTRFIYDKMEERNINFTCMWLVTEYTDPDNPLHSSLNVSIGNLLGLETNFTLNVSVGSSETLQSAVVPDNSTGSLLFQASNIDSIYNITVSFNNFEKKITLPRGRASVYSRIELERAGENIIGEVER
jgi:hypothetical protein